MKVIWNSHRTQAVIKERVVGFEVREAIPEHEGRPGEPGLLVLNMMGFDSRASGLVFEAANDQVELDGLVVQFVYAMEVD